MFWPPSDDYVSITLTDEKDLDVFDMQDRLRRSLPQPAGNQRRKVRQVNYEASAYTAGPPFPL